MTGNGNLTPTNRSQVFDRRRAGVLLHPTSLPHASLGADTTRFLRCLADSGISVWQMLPLGPTLADRSPYSPQSVFAGNPALLDPGDAGSVAELTQNFLSTGGAGGDSYERFCQRNEHWLADFALFAALKRARPDLHWWQWPALIRDRNPDAIGKAATRLRPVIDRIRVEQFLFDVQWRALRDNAREMGIALYGDLPLYVTHDSPDVWVNPQLFKLGPDQQPLVISGVPPDAFASEGQLWHNPLYNWDAMRGEGYLWWIDRVRHQLERFDLLRLDHFRGLHACWEVPAGAESARDGSWQSVPGADLLDVLRGQFGSLPLVAENLGQITLEVEALRKQFALPGMHVLQFAFEGDDGNPHRPENHEKLSAVYTGTHDNDTTLAWYRNLESETRMRVDSMLNCSSSDLPGALIDTALNSKSLLAVFPLQDLLGLGDGNRMNLPGTAKGNWRWKFGWDQIDPAWCASWRERVSAAGRC